jgi:beta-glucanase (GH16 family)
LAALASGASLAETDSVTTTVPKGYALVWSDEFSVDGLPDRKKWTYDTSRNREGWFNYEKQYYAADRLKNARVENGHLIIEAHEEALETAGLPDWGKQKYSSARMMTQGLGEWTNGFFEIRAKIPCGVGTWPAIWMLPADQKTVWPEGGEIDIMEHVGFDPGGINNSVHTKAFNFLKNTQKTSKTKLPDACTAMHKYQLLWTPNFLLMGIDDKPTFLFKRTESDFARWPFIKPQFLLLNIAVGGSWGGQKGIKKDAFPARMEVDYVRVYQRATTVEKQ